MTNEVLTKSLEPFVQQQTCICTRYFNHKWMRHFDWTFNFQHHGSHRLEVVLRAVCNELAKWNFLVFRFHCKEVLQNPTSQKQANTFLMLRLSCCSLTRGCTTAENLFLITFLLGLLRNSQGFMWLMIFMTTGLLFGMFTIVQGWVHFGVSVLKVTSSSPRWLYLGLYLIIFLQPKWCRVLP